MILSLPKRDWGTWSMLRKYLRHRRAVLLLFLAVLVFFPLIHFLSGLPMASIYYSLLILAFLLFVGLSVDGLLYRQRSRMLTEIRAHISLHDHDLPPAASSIEEQYQGIIAELYRMLDSSRHELEAAHADRIEYYTMWVHQIKTPIAAIRLALESGEHSPVIQQELFKIEQYAEMALHFVKLSNLQADLVFGEYELADIVRESVKKYAPLFIGKKLSVAMNDLDARVTTDSKWLSFIIEQFLSNAIKYTSRGGVKLFWDGEALILEDSGMGICARDMERVFEKGFTGYNGRLDKRASGIGLYMARKAADALSVRLHLTSEEGKGTRVELRFPKNLTPM